MKSAGTRSPSRRTIAVCRAALLSTCLAASGTQAAGTVPPGTAAEPVPAAAAVATATAAPAACCRTTDDFPWRDLPALGGRLEVVIDEAAPSYRFHSGDSHFVAFRLPMATAPYRIELRALPAPATDVPGGWRVFYPEAVLLDADHLVSRTAPAENLVLEPVGGELAPQGAYTLFLPMDPATDGEKFLVVHTVPAAAAPEATPQFLQARGAAMRAANGWHAGASDTGRLLVSVVPADDRTAAQANDRRR